MSSTQFAVNDAMAIKVWSQETAVMEREVSEIAKLEGEDADSIIQCKDDFSKTNGKGDQITFAVRARLGGGGFGPGQTAQGNARALTYYSDSFVISELGQTVGVESENTIDAQRVPMNLRKDAKSGLAEWWKDRKAVTFFNHVCGFTPANTETPDASGKKYTGHNTVVAPAASRIIRAGSAATDQALTSADTFTLSLIDRAKELAGLGDNIVAPVTVDGQPKHVMYLDPAQVTSLRTNAGSGGWQDIQKAAMMGGKIKDNPLYTGALGEYNNVILRQSQDVTLGVQSAAPATSVANVRRAVLLGKQAAVCGYGGANKYGPMKYRWSEELFDHGRKLEVGAWSIFGLKKVVFNSIDFGCIVVSTYAARQA
jgi:N4-gp56 family major capsid protein